MHRFHLRNVMRGFKRAAWRFRFRQTSSAASLKSQLPASSSPILGEYGQHHPHSQAALTIDSGSVLEIGPAAPKLVKVLLAVPRYLPNIVPRKFDPEAVSPRRDVWSHSIYFAVLLCFLLRPAAFAGPSLWQVFLVAASSARA